MGSYLSEPVTEKHSNDEENDTFNCGASSMQGWRVTQEDAHNCLLDFDKKTSLFAVYDGHGGHEVALYCAKNLPQFIKETEAYSTENLEKALIDAFLGFDATIATREVVAELKEIAGDKEAEEDSDEEENVDNLYEEAAMPIEQVMEKYTSNLNPNIKNLKDGDKVPVSPFLRARKSNKGAGGSSSSSNNNICKTSADSTETVSSSKEAESSGTTNDKKSSSTVAPEIKIDSKEVDCVTVKNDNACGSAEKEHAIQNGEVTPAVEKDADPKIENDSSETPQENGEISKKGKGKAVVKTKGVILERRTRSKRSVQQLYSKLLTFDSESDSEDEEDQSFVGPNEDSSEEDGDEASAVDNMEDSSEEDYEEEEVDEEEEDECELDEDDEAGLEFAKNMREEPGSDSGCTAVVALLQGNKLYVANAGDSRCIVCRKGKAVEMSFDHKPEDEPERNRVVKAGGKVTADGRVNGGLNLSRAIGDHAYKQNKELSDREQMITALPDVQTLTISPTEDEFMVLACDGIWNFMSSQEVADFVKERINESDVKLSQICEEMFDHCLAPNTFGDGTGCDNMTAIIVQFKRSTSKRPASPSSEEAENLKRAKTETTSSDVQPEASATA